MTSKKTVRGKGRKLRLKKESLKDLDARRGEKIRGAGFLSAAGMLCGATQGCATAQYTNCNVSCVAVCGGGNLKIG